MKRLIARLSLTAAAAALGWGCGSNVPADALLIAREARIAPDYSDVTIPPNVAPLNFTIDEDGEDFAVRVSSESGQSIVVSARHRDAEIPEKAWKALLGSNRGKRLFTAVYVLRQNQWHQFKAIENRIAEEEIDSYVVYRWMRSLHHFMERMYLVQRSLESFRENIVLDSKSIGGSCVNCHTFLNGKTDTMTYQVRSKQFGLPMVLAKGGKVTPVDTRTAGFSRSPAAFTSWHPNGKLIAFSVNKVRPYEHTVGETRGEWDEDADLAVYHVEENRVSSTSAISDPGRRESWPAWSADGKRLYFSSAPQLPFAEFRRVRYDLMQIPFNSTTGAWGKAEVLVSSKEVDMSCVEPRSSPDGKWVIFCGAEYGHMACFVRSSDLYVLNTDTAEHRRLEINSDLSESWPSWSRNGRWISFTSKRRDGLFSHIYFSYFDKDGKAHKPFILPQKDPQYYDSCAMTYNRPELAVEPVRTTGAALAKAICRPSERLEPPKAFNRAETRNPAGPGVHKEWASAAGTKWGDH